MLPFPLTLRVFKPVSVKKGVVTAMQDNFASESFASESFASESFASESFASESFVSGSLSSPSASADPAFMSITSETRTEYLLRIGKAMPRFLQGVYPFAGRGVFGLAQIYFVLIAHSHERYKKGTKP
jgi:hypothetical protein